MLVRVVSGLAAGRFYTQPASAYAHVTLTGMAAPSTTTLYAVPFLNPSGGAITKIGIQVTSFVALSNCELGIYSAVAGVPGSLLLDSGQVTSATNGMKVNTIPGFILQPNALYFLAVGCTANVTVQGTSFASGLTGVTFGLADFVTAPNSNLTTTTWVYAANGLPATFGTASYPTGGVGVPNVYVGP